jgi:hypothetical protein
MRRRIHVCPLCSLSSSRRERASVSYEEEDTCVSLLALYPALSLSSSYDTHVSSSSCSLSIQLSLSSCPIGWDTFMRAHVLSLSLSFSLSLSRSLALSLSLSQCGHIHATAVTQKGIMFMWGQPPGSRPHLAPAQICHAPLRVICVCVCVCMHVCMCVYIHACYVLMNRPIPYITSSHCRRLRVLLTYGEEEDTYITSSQT